MGLAALAALACSTAPTPPAATFSFAVDAPTGAEAYTCFAFDVSDMDGRFVTAIRWAPPVNATGGALHHATLFALSSWSGGDVSTCWDMPSPATGLHVWAAGGDSLVLPSDMGIALPKGTTKLVVQAHVIRTSDGPASSASVTVETTTARPARVAAWLVASAPIPALRPKIAEASTATCTAGGNFHVALDWPHMHLAGTEFHGSVVRADGSVTPLVDVVPWRFDAQRTYALDVPVSAGDAVVTTCDWLNATDSYIFEGPKTSDEMCNHALLVWPEEQATWSGSCP